MPTLQLYIRRKKYCASCKEWLLFAYRTLEATGETQYGNIQITEGNVYVPYDIHLMNSLITKLSNGYRHPTSYEEA